MAHAGAAGYGWDGRTVQMEGHMEYAVKAETNEGNVVILRRGFASTEDAEDHRI